MNNDAVELQFMQIHASELEIALEESEKENQRLRKALEKIANPPIAVTWSWFVMVAKEALKDGE